MPEIPNRDAIDSALTKLLAKEFARQSKRLEMLLGAPADPSNIPPRYWDTLAVAMYGPLLNDLQLAFIMAADRQAASTGDAPTRQDIAAAALNWATAHVTEEIQAFVVKSRAMLAEKLAEAAAEKKKRLMELAALLLLFDDAERAVRIGVPLRDDQRAILDNAPPTEEEFREQLDRENDEQLRATLDDVFHRRRAEAIAIRGVTQAGYHGERHAATEHRRSSGQRVLVAYWEVAKTRNGVPLETVCPVCLPMDGMPETEWHGMEPGRVHPHCMCFANWREADVRESLGG